MPTLRQCARLLAWALVSLACPASAAEIILSDDSGHAVVISNPASRIVTLAPHLTELAFAAGAGERLVGVSAFSDYPPEARSLPWVGDAGNIDLERLVALKPDLVLAWKTGNSPFAVDRLRQLGISVFVFELVELGDIARALRAIGALAGSGGAATEAANDFEAKLESIRAAFMGRKQVSVFVEIWHDPLITVSRRHMMSDVVASCGGRNVFADLAVLTPAIGLESLIETDPEVVVGGSSSMSAAEFERKWERYPYLRAVKQAHVYFVHPDWLQRPTPRVLKGLERICSGLERARERQIYEQANAASSSDRRQDSRK